MKEVTGDLWTYPADWRGVTTNGVVKKDGTCVMGRGCALEARNKYPGLDKELGELISKYGTDVYLFEKYKLFTFPTKHHWYDKSDLRLIGDSAISLETIARQAPEETFLLPRPGCNNGRLRWEQVERVIRFLPDNVLIISR